MPKASIAPKVAQALTEVGVQHTRLVMPTRENIGHLEALLEATCALIETKKLVDKVDTDIRILRTRIDSRLNPPAEKEASGDTAKEGDVPTENAMDVDAEDNGDKDAEGEPDDEEKAPSVVSARNGRNRKQVRLLFFFLFFPFFFRYPFSYDKPSHDDQCRSRPWRLLRPGGRKDKSVVKQSLLK
jgi:DNA methyltransferase 1-associated protein 1